METKIGVQGKGISMIKDAILEEAKYNAEAEENPKLEWEGSLNNDQCPEKVEN